MRKRCARCEVKKPWDDFYARTKWPDGTTRQPQSRCKECVKAVRAEQKRADKAKRPAVWRRRNHRWYAAVRKDPERYAEHLARCRDYRRRRDAIPPERWRVGGPEGRMDPTPVREAVAASGVTPAEIARRIGRAKSTVAKGLRQETIPVELAKAILDAIGLAPVDIGL